MQSLNTGWVCVGSADQILAAMGLGKTAHQARTARPVRSLHQSACICKIPPPICLYVPSVCLSVKPARLACRHDCMPVLESKNGQTWTTTILFKIPPPICLYVPPVCLSVKPARLACRHACMPVLEQDTKQTKTKTGGRVMSRYQRARASRLRMTDTQRDQGLLAHTR